MLFENVAALSTAPAPAGVAVIRISGEDPLSVVEKMFVSKTPPRSFEPYKMYVGKILGDGITDFGMCVYFAAPKSYTGENMVEFHCHGGVAITRAVLRKIFSLGVRSAERGEFTKRAFMNGKLSLSSCEGLIDMIYADSDALARSGYYLYRENLFNRVKKAQDDIKYVLAKISAEIDYPEEGLEVVRTEEIKSTLLAVKNDLASLADTYKTGSKVKSGVKVVIVGKPNAGKSSLLNALLGEDKAIVTPVAGTTRDVVEGSLSINGVRFDFYDTAGIRDTEDEVEKIGVSRSLALTKSADAILFIADPVTGITDEDKKILGELEDNQKVIKIASKKDLKEFLPEYLSISSKSGDGIEELKALLVEKTGVSAISADADFLTEERHFYAIKRAADVLENVLSSIDRDPLDVLTIDIGEAWSSLGEISGETSVEEVVNEIFSKFCVGK